MSENKWTPKLRVVSDHGVWVECVDDNERRWSVSKAEYDKYKFTGLPFVNDEISNKLLDILNGRYYNTLSAEERKDVIIKTLEAFFGVDIDAILPNISDSKLIN